MNKPFHNNLGTRRIPDLPESRFPSADEIVHSTAIAAEARQQSRHPVSQSTVS